MSSQAQGELIRAYPELALVQFVVKSFFTPSLFFVVLGLLCFIERLDGVCLGFVYSLGKKVLCQQILLSLMLI